jgi:hypothetical protein
MQYEHYRSYYKKKMRKQKFNYILCAGTLMPYVPLRLATDRFLLNTQALVDSGAEINVLPHQLGVDLGFIWDNRKVNMRLGGAYSQIPAIAVLLTAAVEKLDPVTLAFAWASNDNVRLVLGQTNFFTLYNICFYQEQGYFEIASKS